MGRVSRFRSLGAAALLLIGMALAGLSDAAPRRAVIHVERVTYRLGGFMSGPYSLSVDFNTGVALETDGFNSRVRMGLEPPPPPKTAQRNLGAAELKRLRSLTLALLRSGADKPPTSSPLIWRKGYRYPVIVFPEICQHSSDALVTFEVAYNGKTKDLSTGEPCLSRQAEVLESAMRCAVRPEEAACKRRGVSRPTT